MGVVGLSREAKATTVEVVLNEEKLVLLDLNSLVYPFLIRISRRLSVLCADVPRVEIVDECERFAKLVKLSGCETRAFRDGSCSFQGKAAMQSFRRDQRDDGFSALLKTMQWQQKNGDIDDEPLLSHRLDMPSNHVDVMLDALAAALTNEGVDVGCDMLLEADTAIAQLCHRRPDDEIVIVSNDSDFNLTAVNVTLVPPAAFEELLRGHPTMGTQYMRLKLGRMDPAPGLTLPQRAVLAGVIAGNDYRPVHKTGTRNRHRPAFTRRFQELGRRDWLGAIPRSGRVAAAVSLVKAGLPVPEGLPAPAMIIDEASLVAALPSHVAPRLFVSDTRSLFVKGVFWHLTSSDSVGLDALPDEQRLGALYCQSGERWAAMTGWVDAVTSGAGLDQIELPDYDGVGLDRCIAAHPVVSLCCLLVAQDAYPDDEDRMSRFASDVYILWSALQRGELDAANRAGLLIVAMFIRMHQLLPLDAVLAALSSFRHDPSRMVMEGLRHVVRGKGVLAVDRLPGVLRAVRHGEALAVATFGWPRFVCNSWLGSFLHSF